MYKPSVRLAGTGYWQRGECPGPLPNCGAGDSPGWTDPGGALLRPEGRAFIEPKSKKGRRTVPVPAVLRSYLAQHKLRLPWSEGLFFGRTPELPFDDSSLSARALTAWEGVQPMTLHEARHTYASLMIAAGVNAKALSEYMGHAS
jgi:integrase